MYPNPKAGDWVTEQNLPFQHRIIVKLGILPVPSDKVRPTKLSDPVPLFSELNQAIFLLPAVLLPFTLRYFYYNYVSHEMPNAWIVWALIFYLTFEILSRWSVFLRHLCVKYGYLNGDRARDMVPFSEVPKVFKEIMAALIIRSAMVVILSYDKTAPPSLTIWTPLQIFIFTVIEDFYYYWLHRLCHESPTLWNVHRLHHTTKAPNYLLPGYASDLQECFDILLVPLMAWYTFPLSFDAFSIWMPIHLTLQIAGHCGVRLHFTSMLTGPFLSPFGLELVGEDHDLHHRHGWRESFNYCKQTAIWDNLFGTMGERIEGHKKNIDRTQFIC